jgi:hypothetical protein
MMTSYCQHDHSSPDDPLFAIGVSLTPDGVNLNIVMEACPHLPDEVQAVIASRLSEELAWVSRGITN